MNMRLVAASVAGLFALTAPASAVAPGVSLASSQFTIELVGYVPVICRASVDASLVGTAAGSNSLGSLNEFCNSPNGYRVHADYSASLANAKIIVDGQPVALSDAGTAVISQSDSAAIDSHTLSLELPEGVAGGQLSFRIEPL
ncbi:MAG TPA: hypothetical protein VHG29_01800 [Novosphingobium sp.]|nr:hypothetical protein [Novosphingobium sp.]